MMCFLMIVQAAHVDYLETGIREVEYDHSLVILANVHLEYYRNSNTAVLGCVSATSITAWMTRFARFICNIIISTAF